MKEKSKARGSVRPNMEYHGNRAKALLRALQAGEGYARGEFQRFHPEGKARVATGAEEFTLSDAQTVIARMNGFANWAAFRREMEKKEAVPADLTFIGIVSTKLKETKAFYLRHFHYTLHIDEAKSLVLRSPTGARTLGFLMPDAASMHSIMGEVFDGKGLYLTFGTDDLALSLEAFRKAGVRIETGPLEMAGERLFMVRDPNGVGIYVSERK